MILCVANILTGNREQAYLKFQLDSNWSENDFQMHTTKMFCSSMEKDKKEKYLFFRMNLHDGVMYIARVILKLTI